MSKILKGVLNYRQNMKAPMIKQLNQVSSTYSVVRIKVVSYQDENCSLKRQLSVLLPLSFKKRSIDSKEVVEWLQALILMEKNLL